jgi:hypothetical protein
MILFNFKGNNIEPRLGTRISQFLKSMIANNRKDRKNGRNSPAFLIWRKDYCITKKNSIKLFWNVM